MTEEQLDKYVEEMTMEQQKKFAKIGLLVSVNLVKRLLEKFMEGKNGYHKI